MKLLKMLFNRSFRQYTMEEITKEIISTFDNIQNELENIFSDGSTTTYELAA